MRLLAGLGAGLLLASPMARAGSFTSAQRAEIVGILRDALKADPSILRDAMRSAEADDRARQDESSRAAVARNRDALLSNPTDPVEGNPAGDVTVVEFYDTRCPYCRSMSPTVAALLRADPDVRLVYKDLPILGPSSQLEARALLAAQRQGGYLRLQHVLMHVTDQSTSAGIRTAAESVGLDGARLLRDMDDPAVQARLEANASLARDLGVQGTPAIVVGQDILPGAMDLADLRAAIAKAREH
jgi:protein-disulfide isomerase